MLCSDFLIYKVSKLLQLKNNWQIQKVNLSQIYTVVYLHTILLYLPKMTKW